MPRIKIVTTFTTYHDVEEDEKINRAELRQQTLAGVSEEFDKDDERLRDQIDNAHDTALCDVTTYIPDSGFQAVSCTVEHKVEVYDE